MEQAGVRIARDGAVWTIEIDAPPLNILSGAVRSALYRAFENLAGAPDARVVILAGAGGRAF